MTGPRADYGLAKTKQKVIKKPYNKLLTNRAGPYWGILALGRFCTDLAALGPYCHDLGPIFPWQYGPRARLVRSY